MCIRDRHYLTAMVSYQTLILASADILLIRMATVLQSLQRVLSLIHIWAEATDANIVFEELEKKHFG